MMILRLDVSKRIAITCTVVLCVLLGGCSSRLVSGIAEPEANEIVAVLHRAGLSSSKSSNDGKTYEVTVSSSSLSSSLQVLRSVGLPKERNTKLPDYVKKEGLVSTPVEERARLMYAIGRDLAQTLEQIDGVIQARVHVVVPSADVLGDKAKPSSVSVFIRHRPGLDTVAFSPKVKQFVLNGIEGLSYDRITVSMFEAEVLAVKSFSSNGGWANEVDSTVVWKIATAVLGFSLAGALWISRKSLTSVPASLKDKLTKGKLSKVSSLAKKSEVSRVDS
jgi:type III secretion protein J